MQEERRIVVSATTGYREETKLQNLSVIAAGLVKVPMEKAWRIVKDFERLPKVDERFLEAQYFEPRQRLLIHMAVYGFHAKMILELRFGESGHAREIHFESVEGSFVGLKGKIRLEDDRRQTTEISMTSDYSSASLPLPRILMGVGLEVVASNVAASMRSYIESSAEGSK